MPTVSNQQLIAAAKAGDQSVLKEWNKQHEGCDTNWVTDEYGCTPLHYACTNGHLDYAKYLIESTGDDINSKNNHGFTPLHWVCGNGQLECVKYLIESCQADVNVKNTNGDTPLHRACYQGRSECVEYLIESTKADVDCKDMEGSTPLHDACAYGHLECAMYLIESMKADINSKNNYGDTPLHRACINGHLECVKYLVESTKADANRKNLQGDTPLHWACYNGSSECVEDLIESTQADIDIKNNRNQTPLDMIKADDQIKMMRSIITGLNHRNSKLQLQMNKQRRTNTITNTITTSSKHNSPATCTTTNISISQDRRSAVLTETKPDVTFLCGQGDEQQPIKANSGVLMVTVPSIQTLIESGIQRQRWNDGTGDETSDETDDGAAPIQTTVPLPNHQPKHVRHVLQCIYTGEISFDDDVPDNIETDDNAHDNANAVDVNQPTPTLNGRDDLHQLILVANEFGFWRLKLVLEAELARKHLTKDIMTDTLIFAHQHNCVLLKDAATRLAAESEKDIFTHPDFSKLILQPQLMGGIHVLCSGGAESDEVDDEYKGMSMMELYKVVDEGAGTSRVDTYMDRVALLAFVRSITSSRVIETDGTAEGEE